MQWSWWFPTSLWKCYALNNVHYLKFVADIAQPDLIVMVRVVDILVVEPVEAENTMDVVGTALREAVARYYIVAVEEHSDMVVGNLLVVVHENDQVLVDSILVEVVYYIVDIAVVVVLVVAVVLVGSVVRVVVVAVVVVEEEAVYMIPYIAVVLVEDTFYSDFAVAGRIAEVWVEEANRPCLYKKKIGIGHSTKWINKRVC